MSPEEVLFLAQVVARQQAVINQLERRVRELEQAQDPKG